MQRDAEFTADFGNATWAKQEKNDHENDEQFTRPNIHRS
jgi:hypothetical protein